MSAVKYVSNDGFCVEITQVSVRKHTTTWAEHRKGKFKGFLDLPNNNTAVVQNFRYEAKDFDCVPA